MFPFSWFGSSWSYDQLPSLQGKTALVTGVSYIAPIDGKVSAQQGIGLHTALELARKGASVFITSRRPDNAALVVEYIRREVPGAEVAVVPMQLDDLQSVRDGARAWAADHRVLDILVNNAGVMGVSTYKPSANGIESQMAINYIAPFLLTRELWPCLLRAPQPRVVTLSSRGHLMARSKFWEFWNDPARYSPYLAYGDTKRAVMMFATELTRRKAAEFFANSCHPGIVDTSLFATAQYAFAGRLLRPLLSTPSDGAKTSVFLAADETTMLATDEPDPAKREQKRRAHRGQYWEPYGKLASLPGSARDPEQLRALWDATEALLAEKGFGGSWPGLTTEA
ncbi:hypothetical protein CXG81DRAFT_11805 [Caulochytrium protostelioides]|uniref:NAD(P)-binding protein n=2 Tax=Caulochytrium protostelioides TaxID=1555241 RepID=A0A4P9X8G0_9FUNG|nr:hypothetical protein CXG81DRAFT_11805 [Caulochytrium protostelioides]|eukprot:RKP01584.1 hypothetical protein CXG81DRAFT_11805 [Caulochytrium protostelioides]